MARCGFAKLRVTSVPAGRQSSRPAARLFIGAEWDGGEAVFVEEVCPAPIVRPGVADIDRLRHGGTGQDDGVAVNHGVGPVELFVVTGDGEALGFVGGLEREALADVCS